MKACRECGCTDDKACTPPCWWVEPDLCSACSGIAICSPDGKAPSESDQQQLREFRDFLLNRGPAPTIRGEGATHGDH